jgi:hypothetical protein
MLSGTFYRTLYYTLWVFVEASIIASGFAYNGKNKEGID